MIKVAVYGTLRKGQGNHALLTGTKYLGRYETEPNYTMYVAPGNGFPGVVPAGFTSISMEVYEVPRALIHELDELEGYEGKDVKGNHYNRKPILTPWGWAMTYFYNRDTKNLTKIESGDWMEHVNQKKPQYHV